MIKSQTVTLPSASNATKQVNLTIQIAIECKDETLYHNFDAIEAYIQDSIGRHAASSTIGALLSPTGKHNLKSHLASDINKRFRQLQLKSQLSTSDILLTQCTLELPESK